MTTDHGLLFKGFLVRQILAGNKLCTRRLVTQRNSADWLGDGFSKRDWEDMEWSKAVLSKAPDDRSAFMVPYRSGGRVGVLPRIRPGHTVWVRETWRVSPESISNDVHYRADEDEPPAPGQWRSSLLMPRWASRITLHVSSVEAQRLQDITESEAKAEGVEPELPIDGGTGLRSYRVGFARAWDRINGKRASWESNPPVWRYGWTAEGIEVR
jgi:hypothetical protein